MKIAVNGRFLIRPFTGIGQYTHYLFQAYALQNPTDQLIMICPQKVDLDLPKNMKVVILPEKKIPGAGLRKTYWEQVQIPNLAKEMDVDILHIPYPANPWNGFDKPVVVTVHDTIPWTMKDYRKSVSTIIYQNRCLKALKKADLILSVSEASKLDIMGTAGFPSASIKVLHNDVAPHFYKKIPEARRKEILKKYKINSQKPFLLYAGGFDERKNVELLVKTYLEDIAPHFNVDLVLAGGKALNQKLYGSFDSLTKETKRPSLRLKGEVVWTGFVEEADFPALYQSCLVFINLSKKEGFNLPLLEAAISGAPIIASDLPVHHEVLDKYGLFCPTEDRNCLNQTIRKMITDDSFRQEQKQKLSGVVFPYSWRENARRLRRFYTQLL